MKRIITITIVVAIATLVFGQGLYKGGDVRISPRLVNYQGYLTDTLGYPITDPSLSMTFAIFDAASSGNQKWTETQPSVSVTKGIFNVLLGSVTPIPDTVFTSSTNRWLELSVAGQALTPRTRILSSPYAYTATYADTAIYARNGGGGGPTGGNWSYRITDTADTTLQTNGRWGLARIGNELIGIADSTHVNFGVSCTTGISGSDNKYCTVAGGLGNVAGGSSAVVAGGELNTAVGLQSVVAGGTNDSASGDNSVVVGGSYNTADGSWAFIGGGNSNEALSYYATVAGGYDNSVTGSYAFIGGGYTNSASNSYATVAGGRSNAASNLYATISGGRGNIASNFYSTIAGGYNNIVESQYGFATGSGTSVPSGYDNSAAFNGQAATAAGETRVGILAKASGTFTIDHPLDPESKILNHYFVESPEMVLIYRGEAKIGKDGKAVVHLPDYFDALNKNPQIVVSGVGTYEVFVESGEKDNRFVIAGKPEAQVNWIVTAERKDPSAEITKILLPVEQPKTGGLAGRSLDDDLLLSTKAQLERMGKAGAFHFRHASQEKRYEEMKKDSKE